MASPHQQTVRSRVEIDPLHDVGGDKTTIVASATKPSPGTRASNDGLSFDYLSGERRLMLLPKTKCLSCPEDSSRDGVVEMTTYQLRFVGRRWSSSVPLGTISALSVDGRKLSVSCKDSRTLVLAAEEQREAAEAYKLLKACAFGSEPFCFSHFPQWATSEEWAYDAKSWYRSWVTRWRGTMPPPWRPSDSNSDYAICSSYPEVFVVPTSIGDGLLASAATFRAEGRIPILTWASETTVASIWRSGQPKVGFQGNKNESDEALVSAVAAGGCCEIVDCRAKSSAAANRLGGHGYESRDRYKETSIAFFNLVNIHSVRTAHKQLIGLAGRTPGDYGSVEDDDSKDATSSIDISWGSLVEDTKWPSAIRRLLAAAWTVAKKVDNGSRVLVHCSHGWDRTSQVTALAQIFLDQRCRTIRGFFQLVEKDFIAFGHPVATRCGHGSCKGDDRQKDEQRSPIFVQFLDAVAQLSRLFPTRFEFDSRLLIHLADHLYSSRFITFMYDTIRERKASKGGPSVWDYLFANAHNLANPLFSEKQENAAFFPPLPFILRNVQLWTDYHLRYASASTTPAIDVERSGEDVRGEVDINPDLVLQDVPYSNAVWLDGLRQARQETYAWQRQAKTSAGRADRSKLFNMLIEEQPAIAASDGAQQ